MKYYVGLDNGGTTTKAAVYNRDGKELYVASMETKMLTPAPGFVERDMEEMWDANCAVIREALEKSGVNPADVAGVAACGHGKGLYLWGKDGKPARNGIISTDNRAYQYPPKWVADGTENETSELACQHIMACQPVSLLAWLRDNEPQCLENIQWIFEAKDYVRFRLTGEARAELSDYSGANLINLHTCDYDDRLLELLGLERYKDALPPVCKATEICGYVTKEAAERTGLKEGTPVAGGVFDLDACLLAADVMDEETICMIAGTWSVNLYLSKKPVTDKQILKHTRNTIFVLPEYYLIEEGSPTSAGNNEWFVKTLLPEAKKEAKAKGKSIYSLMNQWVKEVPTGEFCPIFLPFLLGSNEHPNAKGCFVGMNSFHTRKHMVRGIYEGIAFSHKVHMERLMESYQGTPGVIRLTGGAAKSEVWTQIFADVMNLPVETSEVDETGTLGCAIIAAATVGDYPSIEAATRQMSRVSGRREPIPENVEIYKEKYDLYKKTVESLDCIWDDYQGYVDKHLRD